jgi:hypothetical protein
MINNLQQIKHLLNFENEGDFYMLYVLKRKKDQPEDQRDNHQSVRTIRSYCIKSVEQLEQRYDEVITLCEVFKARAYIYVQKQNHKDVSLSMMVNLASRIQEGNYEQQGLFDSVVGHVRTVNKRWIVDIDTKDEETVTAIARSVDNARPIGPKVEAIIPTKNGYHLITDRFDITEFDKQYSHIDIHKRNPTLLYYPDSLDE